MKVVRVGKACLKMIAGIFLLCAWCPPGVFADALEGGTLDPNIIPKYVTPLVIPPVMHNDGVDNSYDIEVREFKQQILPGGIWNTINGRKDKFNPTRIWSYGPAADPIPRRKLPPIPTLNSITQHTPSKRFQTYPAILTMMCPCAGSTG